MGLGPPPMKRKDERNHHYLDTPPFMKEYPILLETVSILIGYSIQIMETVSLRIKNSIQIMETVSI